VSKDVDDVAIPVVVWWYSAIGFFVGTCELLASGLIQEISSSLRISTVDGGAFVTSFAVGNIVGAVSAVFLGRKASGRGALGCAVGVFSSGAVLTALMTSFGPAIATRLATGIGAGAFWALAGTAVVSSVHHDRRGRAISVFIAGNMLAAVIGAPLGTMVGQATSWRSVMYVLAACVLLGLIVCWPRISPGDITGSPVTKRSGTVWVGVFRAWRIQLALLLVQAAVTACYTFLPVIAADNDSSIVPLQVAFGVGAVVGSQIGGPLGDSWPSRTALVATSTAAGSIVLLCVIRTQSPAAVVAVAALGAAGLACIPVLTAQVAAATAPAYRAAMALNPAVLNVGITLGSFAAARAVAASGDPSSALATGGVLALAAIGAIVLATVAPEGFGNAPTDRI
jgi:DHA1 family inner membrane transport protein